MTSPSDEREQTFAATGPTVVPVPSQQQPRAADPQAPVRSRWSFIGFFFERWYLLLVLAIVVFVGHAMSPYFLTSRNLINIGLTGAVLSVLAIGEFLVIVTAGIDLSLGSTVALSSVVVAELLQHGHDPVLATIVALAAGAAVGAFNGFGVVFLKVTPFIVTLATLSIVAGAAYIIQSGTYIGITDSGFLNVLNATIGTVPLQIAYTLVVMAVAGLMCKFTAFGRRLYAIGGNAEASRLSGLPVARDVFTVYVIAGLLAGLAGVMIAAQLNEGNASIGQGYELNAIAAVVVGGASLFGGVGTPVRAVIGGVIIGVIQNILQLRGVAAEPQLIVQGIVILAAVAFIGRAAGAIRALGSVGSSLIQRSSSSGPDT